MPYKANLLPEYLGAIKGAALVALTAGTNDEPQTLESVEKKLTTVNYVWNPGSLAYEVMRQPSTGGSGSGSTTVDANLTSAGSTKLVGQVTVANPTTSVSLSSQHTVTVSSGVILAAGSSANTIGAVAQGAGSTSVAPWYVISTAAAGAGSTTVDANLTSAGSTKLVGKVDVNNPTTAVTVSSGVVLGAGSSANTIGAVAQGAGSTSVSPWYVISTAGGGAGSTTVDVNSISSSTSHIGNVTVSSGTVVLASAGTTNSVAAVTVANPTTSVTITNPATAVNVANQPTVDLSSVGSTRLVGRVDVNNPTTSVTITNPATAVSLSSQHTVTADLSSVGSTRFVGMNNYETFTVSSRTSVASSADVALFAASTAVRARVVFALSTGADLLLNLSTNVVSSASTGHDLRITAGGYIVFGGQTGNVPLYAGAMRCKVNSTTVNTVAVGLQFTT